jgi:hypothetical protein
MDSGTSVDGLIGMLTESSDARQSAYASTARATHRIWAAIVGMYLMSLSSAGLSIVGWRSLDTLEQRMADDREASERFNLELIRSIERLSESAGLLTSAKQCPVKFRLRSSKEGFPPMLPVTAGLSVQSADGDHRDVCTGVLSESGLVNFGLQEPGQYRVRMITQDGMCLEHYFEVLPDVPVDRLVRCPGACPNGTQFSIRINWPEEQLRHRLAAICRIVPCSFEHEGWIWAPAPNDAEEIVWAQNCPLRQADAEIAESVVAATLPALGESTGQFIAFSRYWRLAEVVFIRLPDSGGTGHQLLGRVQFGDAPADSDPVPIAYSVPVWTCDQPAPRWEAEIENWSIDLPMEILGQLAAALSNDAGTTSASNSMQFDLADSAPDSIDWSSPSRLFASPSLGQPKFIQRIP